MESSLAREMQANSRVETKQPPPFNSLGAARHSSILEGSLVAQTAQTAQTIKAATPRPIPNLSAGASVDVKTERTECLESKPEHPTSALESGDHGALLPAPNLTRTNLLLKPLPAGPRAIPPLTESSPLNKPHGKREKQIVGVGSGIGRSPGVLATTGLIPSSSDEEKAKEGALKKPRTGLSTGEILVDEDMQQEDLNHANMETHAICEGGERREVEKKRDLPEFGLGSSHNTMQGKPEVYDLTDTQRDSEDENQRDMTTSRLRDSSKDEVLDARENTYATDDDLAARAALAAATGELGDGDRPPTAFPQALLPQETPPWIVALQSNLQSSMQQLHHKQDRSHKDLLELATDVQSHGLRVEQLEKTASIHNDLHERSIARIDALEKEVQELRRSQTPPRMRGTGTEAGGHPHYGRSPARSPSVQRDRARDAEEELDIVVGGWRDARRVDAENEVQSLFQAAGISDKWLSLRAPYARTSFVRVQLRFPDPDAPIGFRRVFQNTVLDALKKETWTSSLPDQENVTLWITRHRSPETRTKIQALVASKEFYKAVPFADPHKKREEPDIDWRGKLFVGRWQALGCMDTGADVQAYDQLLPDAKGNHTAWFLKANIFSAITGHPEEALQDMWQQYGANGGTRRQE